MLLTITAIKHGAWNKDFSIHPHSKTNILIHQLLKSIDTEKVGINLKMFPVYLYIQVDMLCTKTLIWMVIALIYTNSIFMLIRVDACHHISRCTSRELDFKF